MAASIIVIDNATERLSRLEAGLRSRVMPRVGASVANLVKGHLFKRDAQPNKNHFPSLHFYSSAAKATTWTSDSTSATVSITRQGFRLRLEGGTVRPVNVKYLTIPARAEAYGKRAREFGNLKMQFGKRRDGTIGPVALVASEGGATHKVFGRREASGTERPVHGGEEGVVMYWLVRETVHPADRTVLPSNQELRECARQAIETAINLLASRQ